MEYGNRDFGNLLPKEIELFQQVVLANKTAFSFELPELGVIKDEVLPPYMIRTIEIAAIWEKPFPIPQKYVLGSS
jgi:hypothetical protein